MSNKPKQVVRVEWEDSCAYMGWWDSVGEEFKSTTVITIGILVERKRDRIIISSSWDEHCKRWIDPLVIPMSAVRKIKMKGNL